MNPEDDRLTDALKDGIDRLMGEVEIPDGLVTRALRRRTERSRFRAMAGSAMAIVAVVGLLAATLAVAPPQLPGHILTTSYVTGQIEQAMSKASSDKLVEQITVTGKGARFVLYRLHPKGEPKERFASLGGAARLRFWFYRSGSRQQGLTSAGKPLWDAVSGRAATYGIDYQARTWWRAAQVPPRATPALRGCKAGSFMLAPWLATPRDWTALIRSALNCGSYKIAAHQRIDGQATIKLVPAHRAHRAFGGLRQTVWVATSTYLPVRVEWAWPGAGHHHLRDVVSDFAWRKPSKATLEQLTAPVPSGFRKLGATFSQELVATLF